MESLIQLIDLHCLLAFSTIGTSYFCVKRLFISQISTFTGKVDTLLLIWVCINSFDLRWWAIVTSLLWHQSFSAIASQGDHLTFLTCNAMNYTNKNFAGKEKMIFFSQNILSVSSSLKTCREGIGLLFNLRLLQLWNTSIKVKDSYQDVNLSSYCKCQTTERRPCHISCCQKVLLISIIV